MKSEKVFEDVTGNQWLNVVNSAGDDRLKTLKVFYYKFNDGRLAVVLKNNWKTLISEIVLNEEELDKEEERLTKVYNLQTSTEQSHTAAFLDLGKLLTPHV